MSGSTLDPMAGTRWQGSDPGGTPSHDLASARQDHGSQHPGWQHPGWQRPVAGDESVTLDDAQAFVLAHCPPAAPVELPPPDALGLTLVTDAVSAYDLPPVDHAVTDGFAVRSVDCLEAPDWLEVVSPPDPVLAGRPPLPLVGPGQAAAVVAGAPVPPGADAVCPVEQCEARGTTVLVYAPVHTGDHIRRAGDAIRTGETVAPAGARLDPALIGLLAAVGCSSVLCHPAPRVGVLSAGVVPGSGLADGFYDTARTTLLAALRGDRVPAVDLGTVGHGASQLATGLCDAAGRCDAIVTTGDITDGAVVRRFFTDFHVDPHRWMHVAVQPAEPFAFAVLTEHARPVEASAGTGAGGAGARGAGAGGAGARGAGAGGAGAGGAGAGGAAAGGAGAGGAGAGTAGAGAGASAGTVPLFCLSGNPMSALVGYELFVRPALRRMAGHRRWWRPTTVALAAEDFALRSDGAVHLVPAVVRAASSGPPSARPSHQYGSHPLQSLAAMNALVVLPEGAAVAAGDPVDAWLLDAEEVFADQPAPTVPPSLSNGLSWSMEPSG